MGAFDISALSDDELEAVEGNLAKRSKYARFCEDEELFPGEAPQKPHRLICQLAQAVLDGEIPRLMIFAPPGTAKSTYISKRLIAFAMGYVPGIKLIAASHTATLAHQFGRESRNIITHPAYQAIWPEVHLRGDSKARHDWATTDGGALYACGFDGGVTGRRADGVIIDDPFKGRNEADSEVIRESTWQTYKSDLRSRLRKNGWIILMHQRWGEDDVAGRILPENWDGRSGWVTARDGEEWFVANLQMVNEFEDDLLGRKVGELLWADWFDAKRVEQDRISEGPRDWNAKFQGRPTTDDGAILKAIWWRKWPGQRPPIVEYIVQSYDTAFEDGEENDFSARTTWGVFDIFHPDNGAMLAEAIAQGRLAPWVDENGKPRKQEIHRWHAILLERMERKLEFHELKRDATDAYKRYKPDRVLIEKKASGHSLLQEMRRGRVPVKAVKADVSKRTRGYAAQVPFQQGAVWYMDRAWAQEVIRHCAKFPNGPHDDIFDTVTQALIWFRRMYHLVLKGEDDYEDEGTDDDRQANVEVPVDA